MSRLIPWPKSIHYHINEISTGYYQSKFIKPKVDPHDLPKK